MPQSLISIFVAILLLVAPRATAQQRIITVNPYDDPKVGHPKKEVPGHKGSATYDIPKDPNIPVHPLAIPSEMTNITEFQNNLVILKADLKANAPFYNKCSILDKEVNTTITNSAILHLYQNDEFQADLLAVNAALIAPRTSEDLPRLINNLGSILIETGHVDVAIPYLKYANKMAPHNPSILNNLGQAYAHQKLYSRASEYLKEVLTILPNHPLANLTMAYINKFASSDQEVLASAENSLKGGFTSHAWQLVQDIDQNARLQDLIKDRITIVEYINDAEPDIPDNCVSVDKTLLLWEEHVKFDQAIHKLKKYCDSINNSDYLLYPPKKKDVDQLMKQAEKMKAEGLRLKNGGMPDLAKLKAMNAGAQEMASSYTGIYDVPYSFFAYLMNTSLLNDRVTDIKNRKDIQIATINEIKQRLENERNEAIAKIKTSREYPDKKSQCKAIDELSNHILDLYNTELQTWRQKRWKWDKDYFNQKLFWLYIDSKDAGEFSGLFYGLMSDFWDEMATLANENEYFWPCEYSPGDKTPEVPDAILDTLKKSAIACPFKKLTVKAATNNSMIMDCQKKVNIWSDPDALSSACTPTGDQGVLAITFLLGLDASLTNFLLVEDGRIMDNTIKWDRTMEWKGPTGNWWLNSGISYINTKEIQ